MDTEILAQNFHLNAWIKLHRIPCLLSRWQCCWWCFRLYPQAARNAARPTSIHGTCPELFRWKFSLAMMSQMGLWGGFSWLSVHFKQWHVFIVSKYLYLLFIFTDSVQILLVLFIFKKFLYFKNWVPFLLFFPNFLVNEAEFPFHNISTIYGSNTFCSLVRSSELLPS